METNLFFELFTDSKTVVDNYFTEIIDSTWKVLDPTCCSLKPIGGANIEHKISINYGNYLCGGAVFHK
jgi:hypothetical protein